jgi:hypothetical protein
MRYIHRFKIFEAIKLSDARKATEIFLNSGGKERYNEYFKGNDRIYFDFIEESEKSDTMVEIQKCLEEKGYDIISYQEGTCRKNGDIKNIFKIQKILNRFGFTDLQNKMDRDPIRASSSVKDKKIVISRHGVDLAGASTGRDWTSCKSLSNGSNLGYVFSETEAGALIAYLIHATDTNIEKPIARIAISVFRNPENKDDLILYPNSEHVYGNYGKPDLINFVKKECLVITKAVNPAFQENSSFYNLDSRCHSDRFRKINTISGKIPNDIKKIINGNLNQYTEIDLNWGENQGYDTSNFFDDIVNQKISVKELSMYIKEVTKNKTDLISPINQIEDDKLRIFIRKNTQLFSKYLDGIYYNIDKVDSNKVNIIAEEYFKLLGPSGFKEAQHVINHTEKPINSLKWVLLKIEELGIYNP